MIKDFSRKYKADILLVLALIIAGALVGVLLLLIFKKSGDEKCVVKVDGVTMYEFDLNEDTEVEIDGYNGGKNTLEIKSGKVRVLDANCPDKLCARQGFIQYDSQSVICLPNRVVVSIESKTTDKIDIKTW